MITSHVNRASIYKTTTSDGEGSMFRMSHYFQKRRHGDRPQSSVEEIKSRQRTISIDRLESGIDLADCGFEMNDHVDKRDSKFSSMIAKVRH